MDDGRESPSLKLFSAEDKRCESPSLRLFSAEPCEVRVRIEPSHALIERLGDLDLRKGIVYVITSPSGKMYVGQTTQPLKRRMAQHRHYNSTCPVLGKAIAKYGWDAMKVNVLAETYAGFLNEVEMMAIRKLNTIAPNGYNVDNGGGPKKGGMHDETKAKISKIKKQEWKDGKFSKVGPHGAEAQARLAETHAKKQKERLAGMEGEQLRIAKRKIATWKVNTDRAKMRRQAARNPELWKEFMEEDAKMTANDRRSLSGAQKRAEKMAKMTPVEAARYLYCARQTAMARAAKRGINFDTLERWYPNMEDIQRVEANGGSWPTSIPSPPASFCKETYESSDEESYSG